MVYPRYEPIYEFSRGEIVESIHFGSIAVVSSAGDVLASHGDPQLETYLRSTAKPFQALPFIEAGGIETYGLSEEEIALVCSSHSGTDEHVRVLRELQGKMGITEADLMCGIHPPYHKPTRKRLEERGEPTTSNRHNCSGKHTGMLGYAKLLRASKNRYLEVRHPVQQHILHTLSDMCSIGPEAIHIGTDGCSAPTFAMPLFNAAWGMARLVDPQDLKVSRQDACRHIVRAMSNHPFMVAGPDRFDTQLMETLNGNIVTKSGAEAFQGIGIPPHFIGDGSPGVGIALKISDGDRGKRAKAPVVVEVLRLCGILSDQALKALSAYGPDRPLINYRDIVVGQGKPSFTLDL